MTAATSRVTVAAPLALAIVLLAGALLGPLNAKAAAVAPAWAIRSLAQPTNFSAAANSACEASPDSEACDSYTLLVTDVGGLSAGAPVTISDTLPAGVSVAGIEGEDLASGAALVCTRIPLQCVNESVVPAGDTLRVRIDVLVEAGLTGSVEDSASVTGGAAPTVTTSDTTTLGSEAAPFGIADFDMQALNASGALEEQAGDHPYSLTTGFYFTNADQPGNTGVFYHPTEDVKDIVLDLPIGLVGNPGAAEACPLNALQGTAAETSCPVGSRVGTLVLEGFGGAFGQSEGVGSETTAVYDMAPEAGYPLELGVNSRGHPILIYGSIVHSASGESLRLAMPGLPSLGVIGASLTLFGDPTEHDGQGSFKALFTSPAICTTDPPPARLEVDTWQHPGLYHTAEATVYREIAGCNRLRFEPVLQVTPETTVADEPTGYDVDIRLPQSENPESPISAEPRQATVTLPVGVSLSPAALGYMAGCAATGPEGINLGSTDLGPVGQDLGDPEASELGAGHPGGDNSSYDDGLYHTAPGHCPLDSRLADVEMLTPLLSRPLWGHLFLAQAPDENGSHDGIYLEAAGSGVIVKLAGSMSLNPLTGQIALTLEGLPQLPLSELELTFPGGAQAPLDNPQQCGTATSSADLTPWSSPTTPDATISSAFAVDLDDNGEACPSAPPFEPSLNAGTITATAGSFSPFTLTISRTESQQYISRFSVALPPGLQWMLSSVPPCEWQLASEGLCPAASQIGITTISLGAGPNPFWLGGRVYLTAGYKGAPYGLSIVSSMQVGPFDLGMEIVRAAIAIDPTTGALTITSDPWPELMDGIQLRTQTVNITIDRPEFVLNPTYCATRQIAATIESAEGASVELSNPFVNPNCQTSPPTPTPVSTPGTAVNDASPPKPTGKPSISHIREQLSGRHLRLTFTTSTSGSVTITGPGTFRYRRHMQIGTHRVTLTLSKRGVFDSRHHRALEFAMTLETGSGSVSRKVIFRP
jgi:hypothetical protein